MGRNGTSSWQDEVRNRQVIINLAGKNIFRRWTERYKKQIYDSRILTSRNLVEALPADPQIPFFSNSALGYYGNRGEDAVTEEEPPRDDFLAEVGKVLVREALQAEAKVGKP